MTPVVLVLGLVWGGVAAAPFARRARRVGPRARGVALAGPTSGAAPPARRDGRVRRVPASLAGPVETVLARRAARRITRRVERDLPVTVDLLAVAVGAGCTPFLAVEVAGRWAPPGLATALQGVGRACALGRSFADALDELATRITSLRPLADALLASDRFGAAVGEALLRLAAEQRAGLRRQAEARARTVPVRLLFPLVFLVLPAFGLLTVVPAILAGFGGA